jgi:4-amino-4-deoxy-L-arabinose transferase-like glycosyltransferase
LATSTRLGHLARLAPAAAVLAVYYAMAVGAVSHKSVTFDEMAHLTAGYSYWADNDYRLQPENGNWPQRWAALPALMGGVQFPTRDQPAWTLSNMYVIGDQFFYLVGNPADAMLWRSRAMVALLGVALGALVFAWTRRLVSPTGAWLSLLLFAFSPTLLAHGALVTSDMAAALFFTAAVAAIWLVLHRLTPWTLLGSAVVVAGVFLSKFSAPILVPIGLLMLAVRLAGRRPLTIAFGRRTIECAGRARQLAACLGVAAVHALVIWALIWASYGFRYAAFAAHTSGKDAFMAPLAHEPGLVTTLVDTARQHHVLPEAYLYGFANTMQYSAQRSAFLNGQFSTTGWWWFFPYAFAVKTTLPALGLGLLALAALVWRWRSDGDHGSWRRRVQASVYAGTPLLVLLAVYWLFAVTSRLNIGHRHLLPTYPALCILAGGAGFWIERLFERAPQAARQTGTQRRKDKVQARRSAATAGWITAAGWLTAALLAWHMVESIRISPNYLAYFNQLAGGPSQGYKHLADSSLDWGQDLPGLKQWLDSHGLQPPASTRVYVSYFGTGRPEYYGIEATQLAGFLDRRPQQHPDPLGGGIYCISATMLDVVAPGFWKPDLDKQYQRLFDTMKVFDQTPPDSQAREDLRHRTGDEFWWRTFLQFDQMRLGRLAAFLRHREPDAQVGYSILIYRLTDADVDAALNGPAPVADGP